MRVETYKVETNWRGRCNLGSSYRGESSLRLTRTATAFSSESNKATERWLTWEPERHVGTVLRW